MTVDTVSVRIRAVLRITAVAMLALAAVDANSGTSASSPSSPQKIVFTRATAEPDIYSINVDGTGLRRLTEHPFSDASPAWSPDGRRIAFVTSLGPLHFGPPQRANVIAIMNADGSYRRDLLQERFDGGHPTWSADGRRIAYERRDPDGWSLHIMNADGTGDVTVLTIPSSADMAPAWSPNGQWIAFASGRTGISQINLVRPDGSGLRALSHPGWSDADPSWSPDGRRILFTAHRRGEAAILFIGNTNGKNRVNLTRRFGFRGTEADWAPDGRRIAFGCVRQSRARICIGDLRTGNVRSLTPRTLLALGPDWQPPRR